MKVLPQCYVDGAVGLAHGSAEVPHALGRGQKWNWQNDAGPDQVDDAEVLDEEKIDRPHLELAHPDVVDDEDVARDGRDDDGRDHDALGAKGHVSGNVVLTDHRRVQKASFTNPG